MLASSLSSKLSLIPPLPDRQPLPSAHTSPSLESLPLKQRYVNSRRPRKRGGSRSHRRCLVWNLFFRNNAVPIILEGEPIIATTEANVEERQPEMDSHAEVTNPRESRTKRSSSSSLQPAKNAKKPRRASSVSHAPPQPPPFDRLQAARERVYLEAAIVGRLPPCTLTCLEKCLFRHAPRPIFLSIRNRILFYWLQQPDEWLSFQRVSELWNQQVAGKEEDVPRSCLLRAVYEYLVRYGYINFGILKSLYRPEYVEKTECAKLQGLPRKSMVVIGAGVAGLSLSRQLHHLIVHSGLPIDVMLLEGRERIGGRVNTRHIVLPSMDPRWNGTATNANAEFFPEIPYRIKNIGVDAGAQIVTGFGRGNPMDILLRRQIHAPIWYFRGDATCPIYDAHGNRIEEKEDSGCELLYNQLLAEACESDGKTHRRPVTSSTHLRPSVPTLGAVFNDILESHPAFPRLTPRYLSILHWHLANLEFANASPLDRVDLRYWDMDDDFAFSGPHAMVQGGYNHLVHRLRAGSVLPVDGSSKSVPLEVPLTMKMGVNITAIEYNAGTAVPGRQDPVVVHCEGGWSVPAELCAITVSLGVLKSNAIRFVPPLPEWKQAVIDQMGFGVLNKVILLFPECFWDPDKDHFGSLMPEPANHSHTIQARAEWEESRGELYMFLNALPQTGLPILVGFIAGKAAVAMEQLPEQEIVRRAFFKLQKIAAKQGNRQIPEPLDHVVTRWQQDKFARGSYSYVSAGCSGSSYDLLAKPVAVPSLDSQGSVGPMLFFAGEATCRNYPATVHGAFLSGLREAAAMVNTFHLRYGCARLKLGKEEVGCYWPQCQDFVSPCFLMDHVLEKHLSGEDREMCLQSPSLDKAPLQDLQDVYPNFFSGDLGGE